MKDTELGRARIRPAAADDAAGLTRIYLDSARHHAAIDPSWHRLPDEDAALAHIQLKLADSASTFFVAEEDGEAIGMLEIRLPPPPLAGSALRPMATARVGIAVREDRRARGIGTSLMRFAERWARGQGCTRMVLDMSSANAGALRFYERLGYRTYGLLLHKTIAAAPVEGAAERRQRAPPQESSRSV